MQRKWTGQGGFGLDGMPKQNLICWLVMLTQMMNREKLAIWGHIMRIYTFFVPTLWDPLSSLPSNVRIVEPGNVYPWFLIGCRLAMADVVSISSGNQEGKEE